MTKTQRQRALYVLSDYLMLNIGWLVFNVVRYMTLPPYFSSSLGSWLQMPSVMAGQLGGPLFIVGCYWLSGYYNRVFYKSRLADLGNTALISLLGTLLVYFVVLIDDRIPERMTSYELLGSLFLSLFVPVYAARLVITQHAIRRIRSGELAFNVLIVGASRDAVQLAHRLDGYLTRMGMRVVGYVADDDGSKTAKHFDRPLYPDTDLAELCQRLGVTHLIVMPSTHGRRSTVERINRMFPMDVSLFVPADIYHLVGTHGQMVSLIGEPLINISSARMSDVTANVKRLGDVCVSALALIVLSPLMLCLAAAVRLDSPGPALFRQERVGFRKKLFKINKFRTMRNDAEAGGPALSSPGDPRVTRLGRTLRKYRLDELPQFWNVLTGDMSLVGPRPERPCYVDRLVARAPYYSLVHQVRPGLTSLGMVKYGYASSLEQMLERLRYDLLYIENISIPNDIKILIHTVRTVITGKGI